jgi:carbon-monoxide dehydrogenase medium subunit
MDLPPVLMALGAHVTALGPAGERTIALQDFYKGYYETELASGELITEVRVPLEPRRRAAYLKCTTRSADDWPALGVAVALEVEENSVREVRVVVSAATAQATRLPGVEAVLRGRRIDAALLERAGEAAATEANVVSGSRGSAPYKRQLLRVFIGRAVREALA